MREDIHSFARPSEVVMHHLELDLDIDFDRQRISGTATLHIKNVAGAAKLYVDTRDLSVAKVTLDEAKSPTRFSLGETKPYMGRPLIIDIEPETKLVHIAYSTSPQAAAVQWLAPEQTAGGSKPFLFTQSQAILARSWIPCQDSPGIRFTYSAKVKTDPGLMAVMSATNPVSKHTGGLYEFEMTQPIPAYLLALAVGDLEFRSVGPRTGVYAEPSVVEKAAWEFADTEKMMDAAEKLYGPYSWERYDIIVLPPSFPFGGMENPRLTFATPTILAGDRSLVSLVAHELAHSWSGNLVTNATWNDFWLNEGFTTYLEHRIMEALYGKEYADMLASLSFQDLKNEITELGADSKDTHLHLNLQNRDPDDGMNAIAYDKGHFFLRTLEATFGRDKWDAFLRGYFERFAFKTTTSAEFVNYLKSELVRGDKELENKLRIDAWIYGPGIPENVARVTSNAFEKVEEQISAWESGTAATNLKTENWTTHHWLHFLHKLPAGLNSGQLRELDETFKFTGTGNSEILCAWLLQVIAGKYEPAYPSLEKFLTTVGRRKFLKPIYEKMAQDPEHLETARRIYHAARPTYHAIAVGTIDDILGVKQ